MASLAQVIIFSLVGGIVSLIGGFLLLKSKTKANTLVKYATPFAAGALLAAAFLDLLTEATHDGLAERALLAALSGILIFFLLERFLHWFHHHHEHGKTETETGASLIIIGDVLHNFIDGIAIAAGFLVNVQTGIVVTLAVAAHEIPQEIGDFALLLHKKMKRHKIILVNVVSALATVVGASLFFVAGQEVALPLDIVLGAVAGMFIYIATSDIIPSIHQSEEKLFAGPQTIMLIVGVLVVGLATTFLHQFIEEPEFGHEFGNEQHRSEHLDDHIH